MALAINETQLSGYHFVSITGDARCPAVLGGTITLVPGDDITCTITNDDDKAGPVGATDQAAVLRDSITITNIRTGASDASSARVTFRLYSDAGCSNHLAARDRLTGAVYSCLACPIRVRPGWGFVFVPFAGESTEQACAHRG